MVRWVISLILFSYVALHLLDLRDLAREPWFRNRRLIGALIVTYLVFQAIELSGNFFLPSRTHLHDWIAVYLGTSGEVSRATPVTALIAIALGIWGFFVISFWDYVSHRFVLHRASFWLFHEYHHLPRRVFNGMPGLSVRPYVLVTTIITYLGAVPCILLPLKYLAPPASAALFLEWLPVLILSLPFVLMLNHSQVLRRHWGVHRAMRALGLTSPQEHVLHHSSRLRCNYGNFSPLWDRLMSSYIAPETVDLVAEPLGLDYDQDFLGTLCLGKWKLSPATREKYALEHLCNFDSNFDSNFESKKT